jgi:uncharacterized protein YbjT (DUF2867 family)
MEGIRYPYYKTKVAAEAVVRENLVPWSILRATQFHQFLELQLRFFSTLPGLTTVPFSWRFQPVDPTEVASRLVEVVLREPAEMLPDFGGPEVLDFKSIAQSWLAARKSKRRLLNLWLPFGRQIAEGKLTCPDHKDGTITFERYLADKYGDQ